VIIDSAVYVDGQRTELDPRMPGAVDEFVTVPHRFDDLDGGEATAPWSAPSGFVWAGLAQPDAAELESWCATLRIEHFNAQEVLTPHMRPVLTVNDNTLQLVLRTVQYDDIAEVAELGEMTMLVRPHALMTIRHGDGSPLSNLRASLESDPTRLRLGPSAVMVAVIERVIDDYGPALDGFELDAIQVEGDVFSDPRRQPVQRLYKLKRELRHMVVAISSLQDPLDRMIRVMGPHLQREVLTDLHEASDQLARAVSRAKSLSELLDSALTASLTQTSVQQNDDMRKISAYVAMAAVPTLIAGIYGMNFDTMPELRWDFGYPAVLVFMGGIVVLLYRQFKKSGWL
jgi:magnesium transporter